MSAGSPSVTPGTGRRFGHAVSLVVNLVLLWVANHLLDWGWPRFLTRDFDEVLPLIRLSFVVSIVGYALLFIWATKGRLKQLIDVITAGIGVAVAIRFLRIYPFDFSTYDTNWSWLVRLVLIMALIGSAVGFIAGTIKLLVWLTKAAAEPRLTGREAP